SSLFSASRPAWLVAVGLDCFRAASTQFRTAESVSSNSRATCAMDLPLVSIRLTTSALNSGVYDRRFRFLVLLDTWTSSFPHLACPPNWGRFKSTRGSRSRRAGQCLAWFERGGRRAQDRCVRP